MPQAFDGLALGSAFVRANFGWKKYCSLAAIFVLITPIGIAIGIGVSKSYAPGSKAALGTEAAFNSVSAGESSSHLLSPLSPPLNHVVEHVVQRFKAYLRAC